MITVSAPGKIHLLGEHAVVYGRPALLAAIDKRLYVTINYQKRKRIFINNSYTQCHAELDSASHENSLKNFQGKPIGIPKQVRDDKREVINTFESDYLIKEVIKVFKKNFSIKNLLPLEITITSQIPVGCGLGSSAALAAAAIGALMKAVKNIWDPTKINELVYKVEKFAHGNPSGADNTTVVLGGLIWYRRELDFLKSIWSLPIKQYKIPRFLLFDSGRPVETTKEMVSLVADLYRKKRKTMRDIFENQEKQTKRLLLSLRQGDRSELIVAVREGEENLEKMGVVGNFARKIVKEIEKAGGAAKISGAGGRKEGSGILLCYHEQLEKIIAIAKKYNTPVFPVKLGGEGIKIEGGDEL